MKPERRGPRYGGSKNPYIGFNGSDSVIPTKSISDQRQSDQTVSAVLDSIASVWETESFRWKLDWGEMTRRLDSFEARVSLARGRLEYTRFLKDSIDNGVLTPSSKAESSAHLAYPRFRAAASLFQRLGDARGEAEALFWIGTYEQVVAKDEDAAAVSLSRARDLASEAGDGLLLSCVARHLGFHAMAEGRNDDARSLLEESVRLRRGLEFPEGVAAASVALAEFEAGHGYPDKALRLLDEVQGIANATGLADELMQIVRETRYAVEKSRPRS
jgi:tetratricopeptide (TPR) repeat protein